MPAKTVARNCRACTLRGCSLRACSTSCSAAMTSPLMARIRARWVKAEAASGSSAIALVKLSIASSVFCAKPTRDAAGLERFGVLGIDGDRRVEIGNGRFELILRQVEHAAEAEHVGVARHQLDRGVVIGNPLVGIFLQIGAKHQCLGLGQGVVIGQSNRVIERLDGLLGFAQWRVAAGRAAFGLPPVRSRS